MNPREEGIETPQEQLDTRVIANAIRFHGMMRFIQPVAIWLLCAIALAVLVSGTWHILMPEDCHWLKDTRRDIASGIASLAAVGGALRVVLARVGRTPDSENGKGTEELQAEFNERFDGFSARIASIEQGQERLARMIGPGLAGPLAE